MAEITSSDRIIEKIQEFNQYLDQSMEVLRSLRSIKEDVEKQSLSLAQKSEQMSQYEKNVSTLWEKAQIVSQKIDEILSPIRKEKEELQRLDKKITEGLAGQDATIRSKIEQGLVAQAELVRKEMVKLNQLQTEFHQGADAFFKGFLENAEKEREKQNDAQKAFQSKIEEALKVISKELESRIADFLYKQNALVANLSQQIDSYQRLTESLKSDLHTQSRQITILASEISKHRQVIENIKNALKQQGEAFNDNLRGLREKDQNLERDNAQMRSVLNDIAGKLNNMKFKKFLGL